MNIEKHRRNLVRQKEQVAFDMKDLLSSTEDLLRSTATYTGAEVEHARARLREQMEAAGEYASDWNNAAKERVRQASTATDEYVREHPWGVLGVAAIIGAIAGHCLVGSRDRRR